MLIDATHPEETRVVIVNGKTHTHVDEGVMTDLLEGLFPAKGQ